MTRKLSLWWIPLILLLGAGYYGYRIYNKPHRQVASAPADYSLTASDLINAFEANEDAANTKYLDKLIEVNGVLNAVKKEDDGGLSVILATDNDMTSVICNFVDTPNAHLPPEGSLVKIKGICSGYLGDAVLERCVLVE